MTLDGQRQPVCQVVRIPYFHPGCAYDYLCFLAGTTRIGWRLYAAIILLCKPASIALYGLGLTVVAQNLLGLWR